MKATGHSQENLDSLYCVNTKKNQHINFNQDCLHVNEANNFTQCCRRKNIKRNLLFVNIAKNKLRNTN